MLIIIKLALLLWLALASTAADEMCDVCSCKDTKVGDQVVSSRIECNLGNLQHIFHNAEFWPYQLRPNVTTPVIDISFDHNIMTRLHPLPAVPIIRFSSTNNHISSVDDKAFSGPSETLEEINLSSNRLTSTLQPDAFASEYSPNSYQPLPKVRVLQLKMNAFHSLHPDLFEHLPALEELYLDQNPFRVIDSLTVKAIASILKLKVLSLSRTGIKTLPDTFLHTPRYLETLDLSYNNLLEVPSTVADARELKTLILDGNPISSFHNESMPALPKLSKLSISRMPYLTIIEDGAFTGLTALQEFNCQLNPKLAIIETYAMAESFEERETNNLTVLYLNNNALTHLSRHIVYHWDQLKKVNLLGNPWSCECTNQWMVTDLMPILDEIDPKTSREMWCYQPPEMAGKSMFELQIHSNHLRCLDLYGNRPENDGAMLIGVLIGSLLAIPVTAMLYLAWAKRGIILGYCFPGHASVASHDDGAASFSRAFYKRRNMAYIHVNH